ncbi:MAG: Rrf2 family transcriptional regulator [Chlorobi bacterium]|nr:Rrf2 family transcriptional regulator [Chlorobiota bacterium]
MKLSAQEEYGLRFLVLLGEKYNYGKGLTIPEISRVEGIPEHSVAKILRVLRINGLLESARGQTGGYTLTVSPDEIRLSEILNILGGRLYDGQYCDSFIAKNGKCSRAVECNVKSVWEIIQSAVDNVVNKITLSDIMQGSFHLPEVSVGNQYR